MATHKSEQVNARTATPKARPGDVARDEWLYGYFKQGTTATAAAGDVLQMVQVQSGDIVIGGALTWDQDAGNTITFDVGDGDNADLYVDGANPTSAAGAASFWSDPSAGGGVDANHAKRYTAQDTVDVTINDGGAGTITSGVVIEMFVQIVKRLGGHVASA